jgi:hypothetical protein
MGASIPACSHGGDFGGMCQRAGHASLGKTGSKHGRQPGDALTEREAQLDAGNAEQKLTSNRDQEKRTLGQSFDVTWTSSIRGGTSRNCLDLARSHSALKLESPTAISNPHHRAAIHQVSLLSRRRLVSFVSHGEPVSALSFSEPSSQRRSFACAARAVAFCAHPTALGGPNCPFCTQYLRGTVMGEDETSAWPASRPRVVCTMVV